MIIAFIVGGTLFGAGLLWLACSRLEESTHRLAQHYGIPEFDTDEHKLEITGLVEHPKTLTLDDLKALPRRT